MYSKNKKLIFLAFILVTQLLIFSGASFPYTKSLLEGKHNLSLGGGQSFMSTNEDQACIFCHTPHNAKVKDSYNKSIPLWNRTIQPDLYNTYTLYGSATFNAGVTQTQPQGMSLLCMSCHDGVSALNVLVNYSAVGQPVMQDSKDQIGDIYYSDGGANIGGARPSPGDPTIRNLSDDHPVSFVYDTNLANSDGALVLPTAANLSPLKLYGGRMECSTCHDVHDEGEILDGTYPFLRMTNDASEMCVKCHIK